MIKLHRVLSVFIIIMISSCSAIKNHTHSPNSTNISTPVSNRSAVQHLYLESKQNRLESNINLAEANLERALRIEPENAFLWYELAQCAHQKGEDKKALELAIKANSLISKNTELNNKINHLIAQIK